MCPISAAKIARPAQEAATGEDASADARAERDEEHVAAPDSRAEGALPDRRAVGIVVDVDERLVTEAVLQSSPDVGPVHTEQVRAEPEQTVGVDDARDADTDGDGGSAGVCHTVGVGRGEEVLAQLCQVVDDRLTLVGRLTPLVDEHRAALVEDDTEDLRTADVDADGRGRRQASDSTRAFRSRMAACRMLPSARRLMKPGSGYA